MPAFCTVTILLLVNRVRMPAGLKTFLARILFQLKTRGMAEIFLAGVLVSFVKLMAYGDIGIGLSFVHGVCFACCSYVLFSASTAAGYGMILPHAGHYPAAEGRGDRYPSGAALLCLLYGGVAGRSDRLPAL